MKRAIVAILIGVAVGVTVGAAAREEPSPYPPGCKPPVAFVSFTLVDTGQGAQTAGDALPASVQNDVGPAETTAQGDLKFETPEGELFVVTELSGGFALEGMRVCGGSVGEEAAS